MKKWKLTIIGATSLVTFNLTGIARPMIIYPSSNTLPTQCDLRDHINSNSGDKFCQCLSTIIGEASSTRQTGCSGIPDKVTEGIHITRICNLLKHCYPLKLTMPEGQMCTDQVGIAIHGGYPGYGIQPKSLWHPYPAC